MFYEHLSAHSLLAKLGRCGWLMRMRLACKKSQKTQDTYKYYIDIRPEAPGMRAKELYPNFTIIGTADLAPSGVWNVPARCRLQPGLKLWFPSRPKEVYTVFEPKRVDNLLYTMIGFFRNSMANQFKDCHTNISLK